MNNQTKLLIAEYKRRIAVMEAATPHNVEIKDPSEQPFDWKHTSNPQWRWDLCDYRIKPEPKYRAWTIDEVPVGAVVRRKKTKGHSQGDPAVIVGIFNDKLYIGECKEDVTCDNLYHNAEVSYDFCKTWQPCGVLES